MSMRKLRLRKSFNEYILTPSKSQDQHLASFGDSVPLCRPPSRSVHDSLSILALAVLDLHN